METKEEKDIETATLERTLGRFKDKFAIVDAEMNVGESLNIIDKDNKECKVGTKLAGGNAENDMKGSQLQTGLDRGDYGSQSEAVGAQKSETNASGKEGTDQLGCQTESVKYDDKSYSQKGEGAARIATLKAEAIKAVKALVEAAVPKKDESMTTPDVNLGPEAGGVPEAVEQGAAKQEAAPAAPAPAAVPQIADQTVTVKLQDEINKKNQEIETGKAVIDGLQQALDVATGGVTAAKTADRGGKPPVSDEMGNKVVPHSAIDPDSFHKSGLNPFDGQPDWSLYDESKAGDSSKTETHTGQEFAVSGDKSYRLASTKKTADEVSPADKKPTEADDTTRYEKEFQGDTSDDEISKGNASTLKSPETAAEVSQAESFLDKKHKEDCKGSVVAFKVEEAKKLAARIKELDDTNDQLKLVDQKLSSSWVYAKAKSASNSGIQQVQASLKNLGDAMTAALKAKPDTQDKAKLLRTHMAQLYRDSKVLLPTAKSVVLVAGGAIHEASVQKTRWERVSPAFKLASVQVQAGVLEPEKLPEKVGEYIKMSGDEFKATERTVIEFLNRPVRNTHTANRLPAVRTEKSASLSFKDELEGLFD
jgi:hypothetical protein